MGVVDGLCGADLLPSPDDLRRNGWPETMVTFDETEGILFSGDAFGCFGALNGGVVDTNINTCLLYTSRCV